MRWLKQLTAPERRRLAEIKAARAVLDAEEQEIMQACRARFISRLDIIELETPSGHKFIVDRRDVSLIEPFNWFAVCHTLKEGKSRRPYIQGKVAGRRVYLHRFLLGEPKGMVIDHIDGDPLNNSRVNLRAVTHKENMGAYIPS